MAPTNPQKHQAGRHLTVAYALLRGYAAKLVGPQTYVEINGRQAAVMLASMGAWQIADVEHFTNTEHALFVLVDVTNAAAELYVVPGGDLRRGVRERHDAFVASFGGTRPRNPASRHAAIEPSHVAEWRDRWSLFDTDNAEISTNAD
jgi:hypothetical protein